MRSAATGRRTCPRRPADVRGQRASEGGSRCSPPWRAGLQCWPTIRASRCAALGGRPGVLSARFAGPGATDEQNVEKLLGELAGSDDRGGTFRLLPLSRASRPSGRRGRGVGGAERLEVEGVTEGTITERPTG